MKDYIVTRKIKGTQTLLVKARNKSEAKKLVNNWDETVEGVDFQIESYGKAIIAKLG